MGIQLRSSKQPPQPQHEDLHQPDLPEPGGLLSRRWLPQPNEDGPAPTKNIAELAIATPQLSTLLAAVKAAGLVDALAGEGPFTVFAPANDAFAKIPSDSL